MSAALFALAAVLAWCHHAPPSTIPYAPPPSTIPYAPPPSTVPGPPQKVAPTPGPVTKK